MKLPISYIILLLVLTNLRAQYSAQDSVRIKSDIRTLQTTHPDSVNTRFKTFLSLASIYENYDLTRGLAYVDSAETLLRENAREDLLSIVYSTRGMFYSNEGRYLEALQQYHTGIADFEKSGNSKAHPGFIYISIGNIFHQLRQYSDAIKFNRKGLVVFQKGEQRIHLKGQAVALNNIGLAQLRLQRPDSALYYFKEGLTLRQQLDDISLLLHSSTHIVEVYLENQQFVKADSMLAYALALKNLDKSDNWYLKLKIQQAILWIGQLKLEQAARQLTELSGKQEVYASEDLATEILEAKLRLALAEPNYQQAHQLADSGYDRALKNQDYEQAILFANMGKDASLRQNNIENALYFSDRVMYIKDSLALKNEGVVSELLSMNAAFNQARKKNKQLQSVSDDYSARISWQNSLLLAASLVILLLIGLFWYINRLSRRQRKNEANQREINQRILAVVNNTDSHIVSINSDGTIRLINQSAMHFFKTWVDSNLKAGDNLFNKIKDKEVRDLWNKWFEKSKQFSGWKEVSQITIKGRTYYYLENFSTITREDGKYAGFVLVGNDITKEHQFNVELSEQRDTLEKSNKAKERMLSILAHDLKDAIYSARSLAEMVTETPDQFPQEELIHLFGLLYSNFDRTKNLLDGLLEWMKTQTGAMEAHISDFSLKKLSREVLEDCQERATAKDIKVVAEIDDDIQVMADREMIKTVMRNLVSNAIKYTEPETGEVIMTTVMNRDKVQVHVKDNGMGISEEMQHKLFQFGGRFSTPGTRNEQGTGFGLSLCKELLRLNNTSLLFESRESNGSDFHFSLPLVDKKQSQLRHTH